MPTHDTPVAPQQRSKPTKERYKPTGPLNHNPVAVREARLARGLTQAALGAKVGRSYTYISEIETGDRDARPELLQAIADALDIRYGLLERSPRQWGLCERCRHQYEVRPDGRTPLHVDDAGEICEDREHAPAGAAA